MRQQISTIKTRQRILTAAYAIVVAVVALAITGQALTAPALRLPFPAGETWWANGPHADTLNGKGPSWNNVDLGPGNKRDGAVLAAAAGTARRFTCQGGFYVRVEHADGWMTQYKHLRATTGSFPRTVAAGERLGTTGAQTCASGTFSHLHFGLYRNGAPVSLDGVSLGGYTVRTNGAVYTGRWTRNADGATALDTGAGELAICCLRNDQAAGPPALAPPTTVPIAGLPSGIAVGFGSVWVSDEKAYLRRIDPITGRQVQLIRLRGDLPADVTIGLGYVWVSRFKNGGFWRINPRTGTVTAGAFTRTRAYRATVGAGSLWAEDDGNESIVRLDPNSGARIGSAVKVTLTKDDQIRASAFGHGALWVVAERRGVPHLIRISPSGALRILRPLPYGGCCGQINLGFTRGAVWLSEITSGEILRINPSDGRTIARVTLPGVFKIAVLGNSLWALNLGDADRGIKTGVTRIDTSSNILGPKMEFRDGMEIAVGYGRVWVTSNNDKQLVVLPPG